MSICRIEVILFIKVATSMRYVYRSCNFDKISIDAVWIKFNTKITDHLNDINKLDSDT